jgi:hypothetical protein
MEIIPEETIESVHDFLANLSKKQGPDYYAEIRKQQPSLTLFAGINISKIKDKNSADTFFKLVAITFHAYKYYNLSIPIISEKNVEFTVKKLMRRLKANDVDGMINLIHKNKEELMQTFLFKVFDEWIFGTDEELSKINKQATMMILVDAFNHEVNKLLPLEEN